MSEPRALRCYEYVNVPYETVRDALRRDAVGIFQRATVAATSRATAVVATLRVGVGALQIGADIEIEPGEMREKRSALGDRTSELELSWTSATASALFPSMKATLSLYPLSANETQIDLDGRYQPPLGVVGSVVDAVVGHRLAEASVLRFVQEVAARLNSELGGG